MFKPKSGRILVIDNGSYESRVGWSDSTSPELQFRNLLTKPRKDRKKESAAEPLINSVIQVGNDIVNIEAVRAQLKTQFDRNVVTHIYNQEQIFDYTFSKLGFDGASSISHPIVLTEALANPNYCRQQLNELLFECYGVPGISYGVDALFSWQNNRKTQEDALIISFGYSTTHIIPILDGNLQAQYVRRLSVGGYHIITYLYRLMQMKYPVHSTAITISRMEAMVHQQCSIAADYQNELQKWTQLDYYEQNVKKIQLPYNAAPAIVTQTPEQKQERRRELAQRLMELNNRRAREKLQEDEQQLQLMQNMRQLYERNNLKKFQNSLQQQQIANLEELDSLIALVRKRIERNKQRSFSTVPKPKAQHVPKPPVNVTQEDWLSDIRSKRSDILKRKQTRQAKRQEQAKRHTHAAQERMRIISTLARNEKGNDDFGMNDADWDVYKRINRYNDDSDSETENEKLLEFEQILRHFEPNFDDSQSIEATAESYQLHFGVEAIRAPEILFQPSMIGCSEAGLTELIAYVLKFFTSSEQQRMVENIFITGGCAQLRGLIERLNKDLREIRPFRSTFNITIANAPVLDSWYGARQFAQSNEFESTLTTRKDYEEHGGEFFKTHKASNLYFVTPKT